MKTIPVEMFVGLTDNTWYPTFVHLPADTPEDHIEEYAKNTLMEQFVPEHQGVSFIGVLWIGEAEESEDDDEDGEESEEGEEMLDIRYRCPECGHQWEERWDCACDSECPSCQERNISAWNHKASDEEWEPDPVWDGVK